jgi:hypothetical protein
MQRHGRGLRARSATSPFTTGTGTGRRPARTGPLTWRSPRPSRRNGTAVRSPTPPSGTSRRHRRRRRGARTLPRSRRKRVVAGRDTSTRQARTGRTGLQVSRSGRTSGCGPRGDPRLSAHPVCLPRPTSPATGRDRRRHGRILTPDRRPRRRHPRRPGSGQALATHPFLAGRPARHRTPRLGHPRPAPGPGPVTRPSRWARHGYGRRYVAPGPPPCRADPAGRGSACAGWTRGR